MPTKWQLSPTQRKYTKSWVPITLLKGEGFYHGNTHIWVTKKEIILKNSTTYFHAKAKSIQEGDKTSMGTKAI